MTKIAYVLSGEGAKGAWQAMAINTLEANGIKPDLLVGTSSGAINAVGYSLLGSLKLASFWGDIKSIKDVFSFNWKFLWQSGFYTTKPLEKKLRSLPGFFTTRVCFPVCSASSGEVKWHELHPGGSFVNMDFVPKVLAAVTIPGVVRADTDYVDGGALILCPLKKAIDLGADEIYVILGRDPSIAKADFKPKPWFSVVAYANRFLELLMFTVIKNDIANCVGINDRVRASEIHAALVMGKKEIKLHILYPKKPLYDSLAFNKCREMLGMIDNIAQIDDIDLRADL